MKKMKKLLMLMAVAVTSFTFTACDDDPWDDSWHDDYYWYDDYNHGGWDGTRGTGTKVRRVRKPNGCLMQLRLWQVIGMEMSSFLSWHPMVIPEITTSLKPI